MSPIGVQTPNIRVINKTLKYVINPHLFLRLGTHSSYFTLQALL